MDQTLLLALLFLAAAILYGSVGHAGASGDAGRAAEVAVDLERRVGVEQVGIGALRSEQVAKQLVRPLAILPFLIGSVPAAFVGGALTLPANIYRPIVGGVLLVAAARFGITAGRASEEFPPRPPWPAGMASGAGIGLLAGLTGTGGGIFLTPLLLAAGWAGTRFAAGASAAFILANSMAGLAGNIGSVGHLPAAIPLWLGAVAVGGVVGSELGSRRLPPPAFRRALAVVLVIAGLKLIFLP